MPGGVYSTMNNKKTFNDYLTKSYRMVKNIETLIDNNDEIIFLTSNKKQVSIKQESNEKLNNIKINYNKSFKKVTNDINTYGVLSSLIQNNEYDNVVNQNDLSCFFYYGKYGEIFKSIKNNEKNENIHSKNNKNFIKVNEMYKDKLLDMITKSNNKKIFNITLCGLYGEVSVINTLIDLFLQITDSYKISLNLSLQGTLFTGLVNNTNLYYDKIVQKNVTEKFKKKLSEIIQFKINDNGNIQFYIIDNNGIKHDYRLEIFKTNLSHSVETNISLKNCYYLYTLSNFLHDLIIDIEEDLKYKYKKGYIKSKSIGLNPVNTYKKLENNKLHNVYNQKFIFNGNIPEFNVSKYKKSEKEIISGETKQPEDIYNEEIISGETKQPEDIYNEEIKKIIKNKNIYNKSLYYNHYFIRLLISEMKYKNKYENDSEYYFSNSEKKEKYKNIDTTPYLICLKLIDQIVKYVNKKKSFISTISTFYTKINSYKNSKNNSIKNPFEYLIRIHSYYQNIALTDEEVEKCYNIFLGYFLNNDVDLPEEIFNIETPFINITQKVKDKKYLIPIYLLHSKNSKNIIEEKKIVKGKGIDFNINTINFTNTNKLFNLSKTDFTNYNNKGINEKYNNINYILEYQNIVSYFKKFNEDKVIYKDNLSSKNIGTLYNNFYNKNSKLKKLKKN